ncbi:hypothetical protein FQN57_001625 [Myotisia sp. PD_48]|nr:hypothetical protein FQN57_001625 [Myotisia sp. PD_48]
MDEFAQTRGVDDLFDDEVIPIPPPQHEATFKEDLHRAEYPHRQQQDPQEPENTQDGYILQNQPLQEPEVTGRAQYRKRGSGRARRDNGMIRRGKQAATVGDSISAPTVTPTAAFAAGSDDNGDVTNVDVGVGARDGDHGQYKQDGGAPGDVASVAVGTAVATASSELLSAETSQLVPATTIKDENQNDIDNEIQNQNQNNQPLADNENPPDDYKKGKKLRAQEMKAKEHIVPKPSPVTGDRSGTGGLRKPKLTEKELSERMAAAKITAAKKAAAHALAEADEATFKEREKIVLEKQLEERQNRRAMLGEREKNRQRKLNAQTGREWDAEKQPDPFPIRGRGGSAYRRGVHGAVLLNDREGVRDSTQPSEYHLRDIDPRGRGRAGGGRGGRGRGSGRGRGAANTQVVGANNARNTADASPPAIGEDRDFPALPKSVETPSTSADSPKTAPKSTAIEPEAQTQPSKDELEANITESKAQTQLLKSEPKDILLSPIVSSGTWADQVEDSEL